MEWKITNAYYKYLLQQELLIRFQIDNKRRSNTTTTTTTTTAQSSSTLCVINPIQFGIPTVEAIPGIVIKPFHQFYNDNKQNKNGALMLLVFRSKVNEYARKPYACLQVKVK